MRSIGQIGGSWCLRVAVLSLAAPAGPAAARFPDKLSDADFWKIVTDFSEPGGYFRITDNFTSNEREVGAVFTMLRAANVQGGVYMGVGPEQNLTYIAAIRPAMAFIVDIRRQAVDAASDVQGGLRAGEGPRRLHLAAVLASRGRPGSRRTTPIQRIWDAFRIAPSDAEAWRRRPTRAIVDLLTKTHGFTFTEDELSTAQAPSIRRSSDFGPEISTRGSGGGGSGTFDVCGSDRLVGGRDGCSRRVSSRPKSTTAP